MATEEKKKDDEEKKEEEIKKSSGFRWRVLVSIIVIIGWLIFLILWFVFYASDYISYHNIAIILVSILIIGAILGISWASWSMKYCWKGKNEKKWWQLKRIWFGFWIILILTAFGILQPLLLESLFEGATESATTLSTLLTIFIALLALFLTGFSFLIYEVLTVRITKDVEEQFKHDLKILEEKERVVHERINENLDRVSIVGKELSKRIEAENKNHQNLFRAKLEMSMGYIFWRLFSVEEEKENNRSISVLKELITLAIERTTISFNYASKLPEKEYKEDIYRINANWVYFLAEAARVNVFEQFKQYREDALKLANKILEEVSKPDYWEGYYEYQESCAWALRHLSDEKDIVSKQQAHEIIRKLQIDRQISFSWKERIEKKWGHLLEEKNKTSNPIKIA